MFVQQQLVPGLDLLEPYNGQLWLLQRGILLVLGVSPLEQLPLALLVTSLLITLLATSVLLQARLQPLFGGLRYQSLAFILLLLLPGAWESLGTTLSLHWWLVFSAAAICLAPAARHRWGTGLELAWLALIGLSGLVSWIVLPIALGALILRRDGVTALRALVVVVTGAIQTLVLMTSTRELGESAGIIDMARITALRVGGVALLSEGWLSDPTRGSTSLLILCAGAAFLIVVFIVAIVGRPWPGIVLGLAAVVSITMGLLGADEPLALLIPPQGGRYFVPALGFAVLILVLGITGRSRATRVLAVVALVAMTFAFVADAVVPSPEPALAPEAWREFATCVDTDTGDCSVGIAPEGWRITVP